MKTAAAESAIDDTCTTDNIPVAVADTIPLAELTSSSSSSLTELKEEAEEFYASSSVTSTISSPKFYRDTFTRPPCIPIKTFTH